MDDSIKLKELQVVSGALKKGDKGLQYNYYFFKRGFFGWRGEGGVIPPLSKGHFFKGIGISEFVLGWELTQRFVSWVAWEGEVWLFLKVGNWGFF